MDPVKPRKSLGQHWLFDLATLDAIADAAQVSTNDTVLEIGPGRGTLTAVLAERSSHVLAVELDEALALQLSLVVPENVKVVKSDILHYDLRQLPSGYKVVANVPYYITSRIIQFLSESQNPPSIAVLLVQKEVAERIAAQPGNMSILAVAAQVYHEVSLDIEVPAYLFTPPPKVDSQVIVLRRRAEPLFEGIVPKDYFRVVRAGFSEKRKKLRSSLAGGLRIEKDQVDEALAIAGVDPEARAQELTLEDWPRLVRALN